MEGKLDDIELKNLDWHEVVAKFYEPLSKELKIADSEIEKVKLEDVPAGEDCELCGKPMIIKTGRFGDFIACSGYPECKNTKPIVKKIGVKCPVCGGDIVVKKSKRGKMFYGCSGYPKCNQVFWNKPVDKKCPECGSILLESKSKQNKYVCSNSECGYKE